MIKGQFPKGSFPGWRTMTAAQRYNARADAIYAEARRLDEKHAREAGWFPTREAHVMFKDAEPGQVCRHLREGEVYQPDTDSYMTVPLRHADSWYAAVRMDQLPKPTTYTAQDKLDDLSVAHQWRHDRGE